MILFNLVIIHFANQISYGIAFFAAYGEEKHH